MCLVIPVWHEPGLQPTTTCIICQGPEKYPHFLLSARVSQTASIISRIDFWLSCLSGRPAVRPYRGVSARVRVRGLPGLTTTHRLVFRCLVGHCPGPHQAYFARPLSPLDTRNMLDIADIAVAVRATTVSRETGGTRDGQWPDWSCISRVLSSQAAGNGRMAAGDVTTWDWGPGRGS